MIDDVYIKYSDFPDTIMAWDHYDPNALPTVSYKNFMFLADKYNELVEIVKSLEEQLNQIQRGLDNE